MTGKEFKFDDSKPISKDKPSDAGAFFESINPPFDDKPNSCCEIAQMLAKWFDKPIDDLPPRLREITEAYVPEWSELSAADRRARADEVDRQQQDALVAKFENARREAEQANAAIPARFKEREFQDGFNLVQRKKNGERDLKAKRGAVNLSVERCIELALKTELGITEWIELTGVGIGDYGGFFLVASDGVNFIKYEQDFIKDWPPEAQIDMLRDNLHEPLKFPSTPARILDFIDSELCSIRGCFSVPDAFRLAVTNAIAGLFDPVKSAQLEAMVPDGLFRPALTSAVLMPVVAPSGAPENDEQAAQVAKPADVRCPPRTRIDGLALAMKVALVAYRANRRTDPTARALFDWLTDHDETGKIVDFDADNDKLTWRRSDGGLADTTFKSFQGRFTNLLRK